MDDRTVFVGLATTAITAVSTFIVTRTKNKSDLTLDERKAQRDAETAERMEIAAQRKELREELRDHLERAEQENERLAAKTAQLESRVEGLETANKQLTGERDDLALRLMEASRREQQHAEAMASAVPLLKAGGGPCGSSSS